MFNLLLAAVPPLNAAPETVVVTAQRAPIAIEQVAVSVSTLERLDLERLGYLTVADALRTLPGISADNSGGLGKQTSVRVRGEAGFRTRVYLDGMELSDVSAPQPEAPWSHVLLDGSLDYVEVLRGPQGLAWGADAGGVVLLQSRADGSGVAAEWGRYDTGRASARAGASGESWRGALNVAWVTTDGINAVLADTSGEVDPYRNTTWHATGGWRPLGGHQLSVVLRRERADNAFDHDFGTPPSNDLRDDYRRDGGRLAWQHDGAWRTDAAVSVLQTERITFENGAESYAYESEVKTLELSAARAGLQLGVDLRDEAGGSHTDSALPEREAYGGYVQGVWQLGGAYVNAGLRYDDIEAAGGRATWRLGATLPQSWGDTRLKWRASAGTGFRAPSLYEVFHNQHRWSGADPAPRLLPERSLGAEVGLDGATDAGLEFDATLFYQRVTRAIVFDMVNYAGYLQNDDTTRGRGVEVALGWPLTSALSVSGNYTYLRSLATDGQPQPRRPRHSLNLSLFWRPVPAAELALHGRALADVGDVQGQRLPDYQLLDVTGRWRLTPALTLTGRVTNALDEDYVEVAGYATQGRAGYVGFSFEF